MNKKEVTKLLSLSFILITFVFAFYFNINNKDAIKNIIEIPQSMRNLPLITKLILIITLITTIPSLNVIKKEVQIAFKDYINKGNVLNFCLKFISLIFYLYCLQISFIVIKILI